MRLTIAILENAVTRMNPLGERELALRDLGLTSLEALTTALADIYDTLDFTGNLLGSADRPLIQADLVSAMSDIAERHVLDSMPRLARLNSLYLAHNRLERLPPAHMFAKRLPNLKVLVLADNRVTSLASLEPLRSCAKLERLVLVDNPVTSVEHYREWIAWRFPTVRALDYRRVSQSERDRGKQLFEQKTASN
ncbi:L domain-like protein, partial [Ramicandelaber brevisporus]